MAKKLRWSPNELPQGFLALPEKVRTGAAQLADQTFLNYSRIETIEGYHVSVTPFMGKSSEITGDFDEFVTIRVFAPKSWKALFQGCIKKELLMSVK